MTIRCTSHGADESIVWEITPGSGAQALIITPVHSDRSGVHHQFRCEFLGSGILAPAPAQPDRRKAFGYLHGPEQARMTIEIQNELVTGKSLFFRVGQSNEGHIVYIASVGDLAAFDFAQYLWIPADRIPWPQSGVKTV